MLTSGLKGLNYETVMIGFSYRVKHAVTGTDSY